MDKFLKKNALDIAKNNPDLVKQHGETIGKMAYENREAIQSYAYEHREEIGKFAYENREMIAKEAYDNQDFLRDVGQGFS